MGAMDVAVKQLQPGASEEEKVKFLQEAAINGQFSTVAEKDTAAAARAAMSRPKAAVGRQKAARRSDTPMSSS